jgi:hypothetical protein
VKWLSAAIRRKTAERHREFDFRVYGSSGDELGEFLAEADAYSNQACEEACDAFEPKLFARVDRVMAGRAPWSPSAAAGRDRGPDHHISPCSWAYAAAAVRDDTSSLVKMLLRCRSTVF